MPRAGTPDWGRHCHVPCATGPNCWNRGSRIHDMERDESIPEGQGSYGRDAS
jgi:hypothetical protein